MRIKQLYQQWQELFKRLGIEGNPKPFFQKIVDAYAKPIRFWHTLELHIAECLLEFETAQHLSINPDQVRFALTCHDAVLDNQQPGNEQASADFAAELAIRMGLSTKFSQAVADLVMATDHLGPQKITGIDSQLVHDCDLAKLGNPWPEFRDYEQRIRQEYAWVSNQDFTHGRSTILQGFLDQGPIFLTDFFHEKYEQQARENLERNIPANTVTRGCNPLLPVNQDPTLNNVGPFFCSKFTRIAYHVTRYAT